ncbi:hypothetical protein MKK64_01025 [Methylobacterium sp. E-025]|uniref:hypothetical protein n=1 Tax=Methylobacterium sp. E-025 TaxID=2836561 RepID=UPI001FBA1DCF|nr:hypothetical protein [Methylobacterium sp. E-025]MCJ2109807.1 hypothetical protein [Methylobacterium sp. E-025]
MDALEATMQRLLTDGRTPSAADFGGLSTVLAEPDAIAGSYFVPEFMTLVLDGADQEDAAVQAFTSRIVEKLDNDIGINAVIDLMAERPPLPNAVEVRCFRRWVALARDRANVPSSRTAALRGALLTKRQDPRRALTLAGCIADSDLDDDPSYLAHAARIGGFLNSETPSPGIVGFLEDLLAVDDAADEAAFELGMDQVGYALSASDGAKAGEHLRHARSRFDASSAKRTSRADAKVLATAIGLLDDFHEERDGDWSNRIAELSREAFAYSEYAAYDDNFLAGAKSVQVAAWASLAVRLGTLTANLQKPGWLDAARIIEGELLAVYSATRTIFRRSSDGGLEWLVRPRIERYVAGHRSQLYVLRDWLGIHGAKELGAVAADLIARTEAALGEGLGPDPLSAAAASPAVVAVLAEGFVSHEQRETIVRQTIADANAYELSNVSPPLADALAVVHQTFLALPEYETDRRAQTLVRTIVYKTMLFVESRMNPTLSLDPTVAYLFIKDGAPNPLEKDLQQDYMRFLMTANLGSLDEVRGVSGGRADVFHQMGGIRFITEVKREEEDASFDHLLAAYGDQTALYQNTNIPIGILLVLDLTTVGGLSGHLKTLYKPVVADLFGDGVKRGVLILRIPAKRVPPSTATVEAKKKISSDKGKARLTAKAAAKAASPPSSPQPGRKRAVPAPSSSVTAPSPTKK